MDKLNGSIIIQGQTKNFNLTLLNPTEDHVLNPNGFNTSNYQIQFIAKQNLTDADNADDVINLPSSRFTIATDGLIAEFSILPTDTSDINIGNKKTVTYEYEVWVESITQPTIHSYPIESGKFTIQKSVRGQG